MATFPQKEKEKIIPKNRDLFLALGVT